ncbi:T9SS type A sorting domain-containing protein [Hymenobacter sp. ASUV-10]|uniref:T9SS type A sorting domain-containing protein n=1 Tax=Hymenobacter aranciens TaxID=3063996 RepID=A0ABT9BFK5_9BACT|nr:IPT/TIG domain-containing protein [Hymenobacter sp. ASUV-10]MDO7875293.1 T9SS type A sorting domain-containing protein [Hymenobacter sp. ASUV-10]
MKHFLHLPNSQPRAGWPWLLGLLLVLLAGPAAWAQAPTLTSVNPTTAPVGATVTFTGTDFTSPARVVFNPFVSGGMLFGGVTATATVVNATTITATVPAGLFAGATTVLVSTSGGLSNTVAFSVAEVPTVFNPMGSTTATATTATVVGSASENGGPITDRGVVYLPGTSTAPTLANATVVQNGTGPGSFNTTVTGLTPSTTYIYRVYATNVAGTGYSSAGTFTTSAPAPTLTTVSPGSAPVGGTITLNGSGLNRLTSVVFSGTTNNVVSSSSYTVNAAGTQITGLVVPSGAITGTLRGGYSISNGGFPPMFFPVNTNALTFTVSAAGPTVTGLSPTAGIAGDVVVITGTGFTSGSTVSFNGTAASVTFTSATSLTATVPTGATSGNVTVTTAGSTSATGSANNFTVYSDLTISTGSAASPVSIAAGTYNNITVTANGFATLTGAVVANGTVLVTSGGSLNTNCQALTGSGDFTLESGATLYICDAAGISSSGSTGAVQLTGDLTFDQDASYVYNGTAAQVTGEGLPFSVRNLTLSNPTTLTLSQGVSIIQVLNLTGAGNLDLNGERLTLSSGSTSGTALVVNAGTGRVLGSTASVRRSYDASLNAGLGYRHYAAAVSGATVDDLEYGRGSSFAPNPAYNTSATPGTVTPYPNIFGYDQSRLATTTNDQSAFDKGWFSPAATDAVAPGTAYTINIRPQPVSVIGTLNTGDYTRTLARNAGATAADAGWHLVGNPYPAPLDWSQVAAADRNGLDAAMYVFESTSQYAGQYRSYVNGQGSGDPLVGSSQGFFVRVSSGQTSGTLTFRNSQRRTSYADQAVVRRNAADLRPQLQLALAGNGLTDALHVYAQAGATAGLDSQFDAAKLSNPTGLNLAALAATGEQLAIDGRPAFAAATSIPLFVGVPAAGSYTLTAASFANLTGARVELVDNLTNTRTALTAGTSYAFTMTGYTAPGRFWLNLTPVAAPLATSAASLEAQVLAYPNPAHGQLTVLRPAAKAASATLLNSLGQSIRTLALPTAETTVDLRGLAAGVYTLRLTLDGQPVAKRVVID